jgi:formate hydrogenlyase transcriptional activator
LRPSHSKWDKLETGQRASILVVTDLGEFQAMEDLSRPTGTIINVEPVKYEIRKQCSFENIIGESRALKRVLNQIETVAPMDSTVLLLGETGTGKELIARAIHYLSSRRERNLVKVNCAAIPTGLLESELFGHEKGAFTGAFAQRIGRFELANHGTMFLDEVGDIPIELQPKLLRVLQEKEFERLGSTRTIHADIRLIAATHADLAEKVNDKEFRSDLYYRLNVFPVVIPPLRQRREDIPLLVRHFVQKYGRRMKKHIDKIPAAAIDVISEHNWPGNVRELENFIERAVILSVSSELKPPLAELTTGKKTSSVSSSSTLKDVEREHILRILKETKWVVGGPSGAAARLGMKRTTLHSLMKRLGINRPTNREIVAQTNGMLRSHSPFKCPACTPGTVYISLEH